MSNRVVLVSLVSALCLAGSLAQADTAPPSAAQQKPAPIAAPQVLPWEARAKMALDLVADKYLAYCHQPGGPAGAGKIALDVAPSGEINSFAYPPGSPFEANLKTRNCIKLILGRAVLPPHTGTAPPLVYSFVLSDSWDAKAKAQLALTSVLACKLPNGPTGTGTADVAVAPNGDVDSVAITDAKFAGTPVGNCVSAKYRGVHFDAYTARANQSSVTVKVDFVIN
jgi:hypothetical protein